MKDEDGDHLIKNKNFFFFLDNLNIIENWDSSSSDFSPLKGKILNENPIYLGKFIGFQGFICNNEWLDRAKAIFEYGTISSGFFNKIKENTV